jgi:hypothetical protein
MQGLQIIILRCFWAEPISDSEPFLSRFALKVWFATVYEHAGQNNDGTLGLSKTADRSKHLLGDLFYTQDEIIRQVAVTEFSFIRRSPNRRLLASP